MSDFKDPDQSSEIRESPKKLKDPNQPTNFQQKSTISKIKDTTQDAAKKFKEYAVEKAGRRGITTIFIIIGIIIFSIGLILNTANYIELQNLYQMNNLGLLSGTEYSYRIYDLQITMYENRIIGQIGAILTAICLIIAAVSPISGKGTPQFSEYLRLGMIVFAAVMIYVAIEL